MPIPYVERGIQPSVPERLSPLHLAAIQERINPQTGRPLERLTLDPKRPLIEQDSYGTDIFVLLSGRLAIQEESEGAVVQIATLQDPGNFVGEMAAIYRRADGEPVRRTARVEAVQTEGEKPPVVIVVPREEFDEWNFAGGQLAKAYAVIVDTARSRFNTAMEREPDKLRKAGYDWVQLPVQPVVEGTIDIPVEESKEVKRPPVVHEIIDFTKVRLQKRRGPFDGVLQEVIEKKQSNN